MTAARDTSSLIAHALQRGTPDCPHHWTTTSECPLCLRGRIVRLCEALASIEAALADERWRREDAEALLQEYRIRLHACGRRPEECWEMSEIDAHFARYKD